MKNKKVVIIIGILIALICISCVAYYLRNRRTYEMQLPQLEEIESITLQKDEKETKISTTTEIKDILYNIYGIKKNTTTASIQDSPVNVTDKIKIDFCTNDNRKVTIFAYRKNNKTYLEQPYNGIYVISEEEYNNIINYLEDNNIALKNFYTYQITEQYPVITNLKEDYSIEDAMKDKCFVVNHARVYNENLYEEFMQNYENKKFAFIRLVQPTIEGDIIIIDIKYDNELDKVIIINDSTRDKFSAQEDRKITIKEYEKIGSYRYNNGNLLWVAYNGQINDEKFKTEDVFILATIN